MSAHPDCELPPAECRIVKSEYDVPPATPWVAVYDGSDQLVSPDPTVHVVDYSCGTCSRAWQERTVGEETTLVDLPSAANPPVNVDVPYAQQEGDQLTCTMGNWVGEPVRYAWQWVRDGNTNIGAGESLTILSEFVGETVACVVTATNSHGSTTAPPSNEVVVAAAEPPARARAAREEVPAYEGQSAREA